MNVDCFRDGCEVDDSSAIQVQASERAASIASSRIILASVCFPHSLHEFLLPVIKAASVIDVNDKGCSNAGNNSRFWNPVAGWMHHDSKNASLGGTFHGSGGLFALGKLEYESFHGVVT